MLSKRVRTVLLLAVLALVATGATASYLHYRKNQAQQDLPTATARKGTFSVLVHCRGELTARHSVQVISPLDVADLQIVWLAPASGAVKTGDPILRFDPSKLQQELKEKGAALQQAQATLDQTTAQARITADADQVEISTARYAVEKARLEAARQAITSAMEGEKSRIDFDLAEEKVKVQTAATEMHKQSDAAKAASQLRLRNEAQAEVDRTRHRLSQMIIKSPLDGVITYLSNFSQGWMNAQPFKVGDHVSAGQAVAEIPDLNTLEMESKVDEVDRGRIAPGKSVLVHVDAFPEKTLAAKLVSISPLTEQSFNEWPPTRSFRAYAQILDKETRLRPGMNAGADIVELRIPEAISIPAKALFTASGKPVVYRKVGGDFLRTSVKVTARNTDEVAIEGIDAGTRISLLEPENTKTL